MVAVYLFGYLPRCIWPVHGGPGIPNRVGRRGVEVKLELHTQLVGLRYHDTFGL